MNQADQALSDYQRLRRYVLALLIGIIGIVLVFGDSSQDESIHERIEWLGQMLMFVGIGGRLWSTLYIGGRKSSEIVQTGPYSMTRNPLYLFSSIAAAGVGAQMGSIIAMIGFAVMCWAAFSLVIKREEAYLSGKMGQSYQDYLDRVPRFFPNPSLYRDTEEVTFRPAMLRRTLRDGFAFFLAVPAFETIEYLQHAGVIPVLFHLW
ncbi:MAG: isoprenylcysteine carboxylmethyltransferase family protein [Rhizobiaceae bacterium]|nr:isoprenylcysteine carboxylmethyltransferase family protein [Rhizobiaceae bacterium]